MKYFASREINSANLDSKQILIIPTPNFCAHTPCFSFSTSYSYLKLFRLGHLTAVIERQSQQQEQDQEQDQGQEQEQEQEQEQAYFSEKKIPTGNYRNDDRLIENTYLPLAIPSQYLAISGNIWPISSQYLANIWQYLANIWQYLANIWQYLAISGNIWQYLAISGNIWTL